MINREEVGGSHGQICQPRLYSAQSTDCRRFRRAGKFFGQVTRERAKARVVVHRIIAVDDYVWAHVNFLNLFNDDPDDTGIAGVDIYKMDADGRRSSIGTPCSSSATRKTRRRWSRRTFPAPIQTECSEKELEMSDALGVLMERNCSKSSGRGICTTRGRDS